MSRSAVQRQQQKQQAQHILSQQQEEMAENEGTAAAASEMFDLFCLATTMRQVLGLHRNMCDILGMRPAPLNEFYPKLKSKIRSWKSMALWKKFDARAAHRVYAKGNACTGTRVLVIGAGPCGLRTAIELQLLGAKVVVVEKRDRISRNNVLHLWPFVITDLRNLGAKKFYGKFCAGSIDHISIRQLQCILLKVALLLGVEVHEGVSFDGIVEPSGDGCGWRSAITPADHVVSHYEFDVLIGADGKRNTLEGFKRKEFRGKLAIAITANFINKKTEAEAKAEEISGVAFIFNQSFFKELYYTTGIDLENIVYYKDETHYFVMTAKKHSLLDKGVIMQDFADPAELLAPANVNTEKLLEYAREAANFSTKNQMPNIEFAVNHYGKPDVAMFDFTSMFAAETSCRVIVRKGFRLLQCLVGDSLLEPFWPTGSGCARGFLSSMDAAYTVKLWANARNSTLAVLAQRESMYRLLNQTTPENLHRDIGSYTVDPATRYPNLNRNSVNVWQVKHLIDTDDPAILEQTFIDTTALTDKALETPVRRKRRSGDSTPLSTVLLRWICAQLHAFEFSKELKEISDVFTNGKVLCALINRYRPDLVDFNAIQNLSAEECNEFAFEILEKDMHIPRVMSGKDTQDMSNVEPKLWLSYLEQICEVFRGEIPHVKHPKMDVSELREKYRYNVSHAPPDFSKLLQISTKQDNKVNMRDMVDVPHSGQRRSGLDENKMKQRQQRKHEIAQGANTPGSSGQAAQNDTPRRAKKRRNVEKAQNFDRDRADIPSAMPRGTDGQFNDRIKSMEQRMVSRPAYGTDKKPKDLMRAIGKIDSTDWNVREIEKKMEQAKKTEIHGPMGREKVPKWSKEQFMARQNKMSKPTRQDSNEEKFKEIDQTLKNLDKQLKEGSVLEVGERGRNKVASIAGQFVRKEDNIDDKNTPPNTVAQKSSSKVALAFKKQAASEKCHFCKQTVYLMEKTNAEGLTLHRSCLKCHHCHTSLRMGGYAFDRDDPNGRFYCTQHYRLPAKAVVPVVRRSGQRKPTQQQQAAAAAAAALANKSVNAEVIADNNDAVGGLNTSDKLRVHADSVAQLDLLDRGQTPERIEFENADAMSDGEPSEENIIDEHEWSGRNFLPDSMNDSESDITSSDESDSDTDSDMLQEAAESPLGAQTLQLATEWIGKQNYTDSDDSIDFYDSSDGIADDGQDDTEGEEFKKARELRREEVRLMPLPPNLPTDTETEVQSDSESATPDEVELNSATEISTDSEFDHDEIIKDTPKIFIDDTHLKKSNKTQIKSVAKYEPTSKEAVTGTSYLSKYQVQPPPPVFKPLVQVDPSLLSNRSPLKNPRPGDYLLNKTASTEGIASKKSLELKKRYLLGEVANGNKIQKSGSTSVLDSRIRSFQSNISECQKLLNPSNVNACTKTLVDRTKLGNISQEKSMQTATNNILNDLKVEITIQKTSSTISTDIEKENVFVNSKNELNKGIEYSESVNNTLLEALKKPPQTPANKQIVDETIDLVTPEKRISIIDLTEPEKKSDSDAHLTPDSNKIIDLTCNSPVDDTIIEESKPDISKDAKQCIPDILGHIEQNIRLEKHVFERRLNGEDEDRLLSNSCDDEKHDSPEKNVDHFENENVQIEVPNIPWVKRKTELVSSTTSSSCTSDTSSIEDIQHYILESTTSPEAHNSDVKLNASHQVPRVEVHDTSGTLMQIDSLMIVDGKYIGDPDDLKYMQLPEGLEVVNLDKNVQDKCGETPEEPAVKTSEIEEDMEQDVEPVTATPEPTDCTVIETTDAQPPLLPDDGPSLPTKEPLVVKRANLKFDTKNENKIESLKALPLILEQTPDKHDKVVKPITLNLNLANMPQKTQVSHITTPTTDIAKDLSPTSVFVDNDKTPTADISRGSEDSETEHTGTGQGLTETELSDWTAEDCISETFIDIEFVVNSNKGPMKKNGKARKATSTKLPMRNDLAGKKAPVAEFEGFLKGIDLDDIEFMDTGSEDSYAEAYSATNTALLRNRGYVEFIEGTNTSLTTYKGSKRSHNKKAPYQQLTTKRDEKLGIDYIEQGAYLNHDTEDNLHDLLKTPVNEIPQALIESTMTQSLTDSSTLNDIDNDSLCLVTQVTTSNTQDSEPLTLVTSALACSPTKSLTDSAVEVVINSTPSSSDKKSSSNKVNTYKSASQKHKEDLTSYEEYVRSLQQKITQISSTSRDSLDARKHKRKSSKGEESNSYNNVQNTNKINNYAANNNSSSSSLTNRVPEIPSLTSKLEEISKERNKQKDLIHDLVMDKLHSKKQLNAEKRLHRSRQRNLLTSGYSSGASLSPTPKLAAAANVNDNNCTSTAHYHDSTAAAENKFLPKHNVDSKENIALQKSSSYVAAYGQASPLTISRSSTTSTVSASKQRPFSEHLNAEKIDAFEVSNLKKTPSFSYALPSSTRPLPFKSQNDNVTPIVRTNQKEHTINTSTENLRSEARARARLKSNSELGLSPEEKMQLLRKRLHAEHGTSSRMTSTTTSAQTSPSKAILPTTHKIFNSKSVNDIAHMNAQLQQKEEFIINNNNNKADFLSDPNLLLDNDDNDSKKITTKSNRRVKDPERRKSLIQSLSSFFHKNTASKESASSGNSAQLERPETVKTASITNSSSLPTTTATASLPVPNDGGMFSRFRISPKHKEKSKSCFDVRNLGFGDKELGQQLAFRSPTATVTVTTTTTTTRNNCGALQQQQQEQTNKQNNYKNKTNKNTGFSSSSPQLCMHVNKTNSADDIIPPPIPPLPLNYQRSDDESYANETREQKKHRAISKATRQAELKRLRIAQEIQREQEEIEVQLKELEARGVIIEKALRGESQNLDNLKDNNGATVNNSDENLLKELLDIWRNITQLKKRDEELGIRQQELQLEHRHAQLKEELNLRLSNNKLDKSSADVAAEGAILNEMLEIVAKRASLRPNSSNLDLSTAEDQLAATSTLPTSSRATTLAFEASADVLSQQTRDRSYENNESNI